MLEAIEPLPRGRVLDLPCGPGLLSEALRRLGFHVVAADLDAEGFAPRDRIPFYRVDLDAPLPFPDACFDLVHCGDGIEHLENPFQALRELARLLAPGGRLVLTTPNYLSLERRLRFLWSGSLAKPLPRDGAAGRERGHVNPITLTRLCWMAEAAGLEPVSARAFLASRRRWLLWPLALPVWCVGRLLPARYRRDLYAEHTLGWSLLTGGRKLLAVFAKRSGRGGARPPRKQR